MAVLAAGGHLSVEAIASRVRDRLGTVSVQAVYDVLRALGDAGLVRRIQPAGSPALFEARAGDNHHHLICRACGAVVDVDCVVGEAPCLEPDRDAGSTFDRTPFRAMTYECGAADGGRACSGRRGGNPCRTSITTRMPIRCGRSPS
jgi:Fe2+ or Zn2+ uptake regulation protein